jgi:inosine/xanthosine triphosphatase
MKKLYTAIASKNPAKVNAVSAVLTELGFDFELQPIDAASGVSAQPFSMEETRLGAVNRSQLAVQAGADLAIGLEGGVFDMEGTLFLCNWGALATKEGKLFTAAGAQIPLPTEIADRLRKGAELGPVMDEYTNEKGIRHHKGAIGILTAGLINREEMFQHVVKLLVGQYLLGAD